MILLFIICGKRSMMQEHSYQTFLRWTGNRGDGTQNYRAYDRAYEIEVESKPIIRGSSDPAFRGDKTKYNPEELLVASVSSCHMLWYLHLCAEGGVIVVNYCDRAIGKMRETENGSGKFIAVILQPEVTITADSSLERAERLHHKAHEFCFIANSVNFPILCHPAIKK
jgi:organic hydroperoxide reductase OsmC/OhrA